mmetsp:Transcript_127600/g.272051  ORF Transcript_127600/g.272051 Transcript_127600/m.272051 type:complete len:240 (+) Transcript_127600:1587-2306(+)
MGPIRSRWQAIELHTDTVEPAVQAHEDVGGLPQALDDDCLPPLLHVPRPPGHDADDAHPSAYLLPRKQHADLPDDVLGRSGANIPEVFQRAQLARLEEEPLGAQRPLALVNLKGEHDGQHEISVGVAAEVLGQEVGEALPQVLQEATVGVAMVHDLHQLHRATLDDLLEHVLGVEDGGAPILIRVEAPNVVHRAILEGRQQMVQVAQVVLAHGMQPLAGQGIGTLGFGHALHQGLRPIS